MEGTILSHFAIIEKIGEGGMGVVYKARDTRLDRMVAIKLLPDSKLADADRKLRFIQEAKAASALNHPNIVVIHEIADHDGHSFIVMELVDGASLSELIPKRGMKLAEALRLAVQIADALAAAHAVGIVHRDLKPGNIMVDARGRVKVLDFGLAKLIAPAGSESAETQTVAMQQPVTEQGAIVGSIPYMSPEQAEGKPVDARSDIFSFGAVLYEMITGQRAFSGESRASTLAALLEHDPRPPSEISQTTPPELERLIGRCLRKDVNKRSQHMSDVKLALEELRDDSESGKLIQPLSATQRGFAGWPRWVWPAILATLIVAVAAGWIYRSRSAGRGFRAPQLMPLSPDDGFSYSAPAISPDGKLVAYVSDRSGKPQLWLQQVGGTSPIQLTHSENIVTKASFFPDGTRILYLASSPTPNGRDSLEIIPTLGGEPRVLAEGSFRHTKFPNFSISPDGHQVAYIEADRSHRSLMVKPTDGGQARSLPAWDNFQLRNVFLPVVQWTADNRFVLCVGSARPEAKNLVEASEWFAVPVDGGKPIPTGAGERLRAAGFDFAVPSAVTGDRVFFNGPSVELGHVWEIELSPSTWRITGDPQQLTFGTEDEIAMSVSTGAVAAVQTGKLYSDIYLLPLDPATGNASGITRRLTQDNRYKAFIDSTLVAIGGDLRLAYFTVALQTHSAFSLGVYSLDLETGKQNQLTALTSHGTTWTFSRDERQVAYSAPNGNLFSISVGEAGSPVDSARMLCRDCGRASAFSPDGHFLLYDPGRPVHTDPGRKAMIHLLDVSSGKDHAWLEHPTDSVELQGFTGNAGEWAVVSTRALKSGDASVRTFLIPWSEALVSPSEWIEVPAMNAKFSADGNLAYYFKGSELEAMKFDPKTKRFSEPYQVKLAPGSQPLLNPNDPWVVRGPGIAFARQETKMAVWLMKLPQ